MTTTFFYFLAFIALLVAGGYTVTRKWDDVPKTALQKKSDDMNLLTQQYNEVIQMMEDSYKHENTSSFRTRKEYSKRYEKVEKEYKQNRKSKQESWMKAHPLWVKARKLWGRIFVIGLVSSMVSCIYTIGSEEEESHAIATQAVSNTETTYWNATNIPMPHLEDARQYVSNPDYVLSQATVDSLNLILQRMDSNLGIESVVIIVNHIENDDPYRMAQDVGNRYGVGRNDRGLVIVVGYQDHSINMSPGRQLEADLTDAECHRLEQTYVIPGMRAEQPDSAMLYLLKGTYALLQKKELPAMSPLLSDSDEGDEVAALLGLYVLFVMGWLIFFVRLNRKYQWLGMVGTIPLLANPFYIEESSSHGGGGFGGFSGGGGGFGGGGGGFGGGGGGFGGGSFGGGGATSRW